MMKATAYANSNMALTKYWGKRDDRLILPYNSSLSVTYDGLGSKTTVEFNKIYDHDFFKLDGKNYSKGEEYDRIVGQLTLVRKLAKITYFARVESINSVAFSSGLASSASGAAALAMASAKAAGLNLSSKEHSILARMGSGSGCRSIYGGFVKWQKGTKKDGSDSFAVQVADENYWPELCLLAVIVKKAVKKVKSRAGMAASVKTSPYYQNWKKEAEVDTKKVEKALLNKDFTTLGEIAEYNCLKMHAVMLSTQPSLIYWQPATIAIMHEVQNMRDDNISAYFTIDAGPQIVILCLRSQLGKICNRIKSLNMCEDIIPLKLGKNAEYLSDHLF